MKVRNLGCNNKCFSETYVLMSSCPPTGWIRALQDGVRHAYVLAVHRIQAWPECLRGVERGSTLYMPDLKENAILIYHRIALAKRALSS